jgi:hypothetical protein
MIAVHQSTDARKGVSVLASYGHASLPDANDAINAGSP